MSIGHLQDQGLRAAREGRAIRRYLRDITVTNAYVVSTNAALYYDIPAGKQVVIPRVFVGCEDANKYAGAYIVGCAAIAGGGAATQLQNEIHDHVGDKKEGPDHTMKDCNPPLVIKYSAGYRSVSLAVKATDNLATVGFGWNGWVEDEGTLS